MKASFGKLPAKLMSQNGASKPPWTLWAVIGLYASALVVAASLLPLRLAELLQLAGSTAPIPAGLLRWASLTPGDAPLNYFFEAGAVRSLGHAPWVVRLPSLLFAIGAAWIFWRLAVLANIRRWNIALLVFLFLPLHYQAATEGRPFEQALFFTLLSYLLFFRLVQAPSIARTAFYACVLVACLYSDPISFFVCVGSILGLLLFMRSKAIRIVIWHALAAAAVAALLYAPFMVWKERFQGPYWLWGHDAVYFSQDAWAALFRDFSGGGAIGYGVSAALLAGVIVTLWRLIKARNQEGTWKLTFVCFLSGSVLAIVMSLLTDFLSSKPISPERLLFAMPGCVLLFAFALEWLFVKAAPVGWLVAATLFLSVAAGDYSFLTTHPENFEALSRVAVNEFTDDSCVVFLSEKLSRSLFDVIEPRLRQKECINFFHKRILLLSHPYVLPDEQEDGEDYFRGLNYHEVKRVRAGAGLLVVLEQDLGQSQ
jgi:4-amino-4-deoxy-L-arabinose transferase-like glycosyltransferase